MLDVIKIKSDFPMLNKQNENMPLVYLDSAATSLKPQIVIDSISKYYENYGATVHRGVYELSHRATKIYDETRKKIAKHINTNSNQIIFTKNATDSLNLVANSFGALHISEGDEILVTEFEHHANYLPWLELARKNKAKLIVVEALNNHFSTEQIIKHVSRKTKIIAIHHISNVIGDVIDVDAICEYATKQGIITVIDGAQAIPHIKVDVTKMQCDFYVFTGHKICGPTGIGVLYGKSEHLNKMPPITFGGDMIDTVGDEFTPSTWKEAPLKFEAGTPQIAEVIGLGAALDYINQFDFDEIYEHEVNLKKYAVKELKKLENVTIYNENTNSGIIAFNIDNVPMHDVASYLNQDGIAVRAGQHCSQPTMNALGVHATLRISLYIYNDKKDIDTLITSLQKLSQKEDAFLDVLFK